MLPSIISYVQSGGHVVMSFLEYVENINIDIYLAFQQVL